MPMLICQFLLRLLLAASALVLLVACVNTASLFLARAAAKQRETQIRAFLGANARQLLAPIVAESAFLLVDPALNNRDT